MFNLPAVSRAHFSVKKYFNFSSLDKKWSFYLGILHGASLGSTAWVLNLLVLLIFLSLGQNAQLTYLREEGGVCFSSLSLIQYVHGREDMEART